MTKTLTRRAGQRRAIEGDQARRMTFLPATFDAEAGTVEAVFATETPVQRWFGTEILRCQPDAIDYSRFQSAPVLDSHNLSSIDRIVGRVTSHRIEGGKLVGMIRFSESDAGQRAKQLVGEGMIGSTSVGYRILEQEERRLRDGTLEVIATRWSPHEVSLTAVPADPNAKIRSRDTNDMDPEDIETIERDDAPPARPQRATRLQREIDSLRENAIRAGATEEDLDEALDGVRTVDQARGAVFSAMAARSERTRTEPARQPERSRGRQDETRSLAVDALAARLGAQPQLQGNNPFAGQPIVGMMRGLLENAGVATRQMTDRSIAERMLHAGASWISDGTRGMHTTSDFPALLMEAGNRALMARFDAYRTPLKALSMKRNARDYRPQSFIRPGEAPELLPRSENGEIQNGTLGEEKNGLQIQNLARMFAMSREAVINDDLGAFSDFLGAFALSAATTESKRFFALLSANGFGGVKLPDGKSWFHADHGNLAAAGSAIGVASLDAARIAMQTQRNVNGTSFAPAAPAVLLVGPAKQTAAEQIVASLTPSQISDVNPFAGKLRVEVEPLYEGNGWWLFADPATRPALVHGYLDGLEGPQIETQEGWRIPGIEFRCMLDFGCNVYDWRAAYFNPGV